MPNNILCRICLCKGVKMYSSNEYDLKWFYEEIMGKRVNNDVLPQHFCYICAALLFKFHKFKEKCCTSEKMLNNLVFNEPITPDTISQTDRRNKNLISPISIIIASKKVKSYRIKSHTMLHSDPEMIEVDNNFSDTKKTSDDDEIIDEQKAIVDDYNNIHMIALNDNKEFNIKHDDKTIKIEDTLNIASNDTENEVFAEAIEAVINESNDVILNDDDDNMSDDNFLSEIANEIHKTEIDTDFKIVKRKSKRKTKKKKDTSKIAKKSKDKSKKKIDDVEKKPGRRKATFPGGKVSQLNKEHWLKIQLTEEEAMAEHSSKAKDPKYNNMAAQYKCTDCYKVFSKEEMVVRHRKMRHDESRKIVCRFCNRHFRVNYELTNHIIFHYTRYKCLRCDLVLNRESSANFHNDYHNGVIRKCEHCGKEYRHASTYYTHLRTMHRSDHVCTLCGESFVSEAGLRLHKQLSHATTVIDPAEVNIHCDRCDIVFETRKAFDEHLIHSAMHADDVEDLIDSATGKLPTKKKTERKPKIPSQCEVCFSNFETRKAYIKHFGEAHPGLPSPIYKIYLLNQRVVCEICGQSVSLAGISTHKNRHTREKLVKCATCGMEFTTKTGLKIHLVKHTGEKPYKCRLCEKRFTQSGSMGLHYRTYHLKEPYPKRNRNKKNEEPFLNYQNREEDTDGCLKIRLENY